MTLAMVTDEGNRRGGKLKGSTLIDERQNGEAVIICMYKLVLSEDADKQ